MQKIECKISIEAPKEKVWKVLFEDKTYREWVAVFMPESYAETDWSEGSRALFLSPDGKGMISKVAIHRPNEILTLEHLGMIDNGKEDFDSDEVKPWQGLHEEYRVVENDGITELTLEQELDEKYVEWFSSKWKEALSKIKSLSEA